MDVIPIIPVIPTYGCGITGITNEVPCLLSLTVSPGMLPLNDVATRRCPADRAGANLFPPVPLFLIFIFFQHFWCSLSGEDTFFGLGWGKKGAETNGKEYKKYKKLYN